MYSMKCTCSVSGAFQVKVQCLMYNVKCAGCSVMPAKVEDFTVNTGWVKKISEEINFQKHISLVYFLKTVWCCGFLKT